MTKNWEINNISKHFHLLQKNVNLFCKFSLWFVQTPMPIRLSFKMTRIWEIRRSKYLNLLRKFCSYVYFVKLVYGLQHCLSFKMTRIWEIKTSKYFHLLHLSVQKFRLYVYFVKLRKNKTMKIARSKTWAVSTPTYLFALTLDSSH